ncbi:MAG: hypothetical protein V3S24_06295 [Candidatus Tectomicrobia bacterium]
MWSKGGTVLLALLVSACANPPRTKVGGEVGAGHVSLFEATTVIPKDHIQAIALFTDNDQTKQPVQAYYGWARVVCAP